MKKFGYLLFFLSFLLLPFSVSASEVNYDIDAYKIDASIKEDGSLDVCEYIKQTGTFNGYVRDLVYNGSNRLYSASGISNINVFDLNVSNMSRGEKFTLVSSASKGDRLVYEMDSRYNGYSLTMYNASKSSSRGYVVCYTLNDVVLVHNDVAELYWNFIGDGFDDLLSNVSINVYLPNKDETLRVWAHGPLYGEVYPYHDVTSYVKASIAYVNPNNAIDVRMTFNKDLVPFATKTDDSDALSSILAEEEERANDANRQRERAKTIILIQKIVFYAYFVIIIAILVYAYFKYDKELKSSFTNKYYRDFPNNYGPCDVEYLFKKRITTLSYSASILEIIRKKALKVEDVDGKKNKYKLVVGDAKEDLTGEEARIFNFIVNTIGNGKEVTLDALNNYGKRESTANKFLNNFNTWKEATTRKAKTLNFFEKSKTGLLIVIVLLLSIGAGLLVLSYNPLWMVLIFIVGVSAIIYLACIKKRTKEGVLEYSKWLAFKRFLLDFSRLDEKELPEIALWEKYLVYATVLGVAKELQQTMKIRLNEMGNTNTDDLTRMYMMNSIINSNLNQTINNTVSRAISVSNSTIAASQSSSGSGGGGGFSSGGGFGGGGGGGHGF